MLHETSRDATRPLREPVLAPTLGKGPGGRFPQRGGSLPLLNAHNVARIRATHAARLRNTARLTPSTGLLGCTPFPMYPKGTWPAEARASNGPTAISNNGGPPHAGASANRPADQYGSAPQGRPIQARQGTGDRRQSSGGRFRQEPRIAAIPADQHGSPQQAGQRFH